MPVVSMSSDGTSLGCGLSALAPISKTITLTWLMPEICERHLLALPHIFVDLAAFRRHSKLKYSSGGNKTFFVLTIDKCEWIWTIQQNFRTNYQTDNRDNTITVCVIHLGPVVCRFLKSLLKLSIGQTLEFTVYPASIK